jgi:hypothetical protein
VTADHLDVELRMIVLAKSLVHGEHRDQQAATTQRREGLLNGVVLRLTDRREFARVVLPEEDAQELDVVKVRDSSEPLFSGVDNEKIFSSPRREDA